MKQLDITKQIDNTSLKGVSILVAEDNPLNRIVVCKVLKKWGILFMEAHNGKEAIEKFKNNQFDLILMDIEMPVMNGYEAISELKKIGVSIPILAFTSLQHNNVLCELRKKGFNDMVIKPFNPTDLLIRIQHYINASTSSGCI